MFRFAWPNYLWALTATPLIALFFWTAFRRRRRFLQRFGQSALISKLTGNVSLLRRRWKAALLVAGLALLVLTAARPQFGTRLETVKREGQDIIVALDVSLSMMAEDIAPNRLEKAKHFIESLIGRLEGDRIGLIAFAGEAFVQCPLTLDYGAAVMFLRSMDPEAVPLAGTAVDKAIRLATRSFVAQETQHKILILITDGEHHEGDPLEAAQEAVGQGVAIYAVGIGSPQGVPIPVAPGGLGGFKKDDQGSVVLTRLDEQSLRAIATAAQGRYFRATPSEDELGRIAEEIAALDKKEVASQQLTQFDEKYQLILALAPAVLLAEWLISERTRPRSLWKGRFQ